MELEQRIARLEAIEAIRKLKAQYLSACDLKELDGIRECFAEGEVHIDYGMLGIHKHREALIGLFDQLGNHPHIHDSHHGQNAVIDILSETTAKAQWQLSFQQINTQENTVTQFAGLYQDQYQKVGEQWLITSTVFKVLSTHISKITDGNIEVVFAGGQMPMPAMTE